jgi:hypothetical protein
MDGSSQAFGSVGAVTGQLQSFSNSRRYVRNLLTHTHGLGVKNPIRLAKAVMDYSQRSDPLGRIPPL